MVLDHSTDPKDMNVLLVEDNQDNADLFVRILNTANYEVTHTLRGLEGLKLARQQTFSAILLDFDLPDINGLQVCVAMRKFLKTTPIIALTAKADRATREQARLSGFDAFVTKPCLDKDLLQTIQTTVEQVEIQNAKATADALAIIEAKAMAELRAKAAAELKASEASLAAINPIEIQTALEGTAVPTSPAPSSALPEPSVAPTIATNPTAAIEAKAEGAPLVSVTGPTPEPAEAKTI
jgi:two-component system, OmpR family, phosphate regulon response regulator PhoB